MALFKGVVALFQTFVDAFLPKIPKTQPLKKSRDYFFLDHLFISKNQVPNTSLPIEPHTCNFSLFSPCITLWLIAPSESKKITLFIKSSRPCSRKTSFSKNKEKAQPLFHQDRDQETLSKPTSSSPSLPYIKLYNKGYRVIKGVGV